jgi:hypothetical protein
MHAVCRTAGQPTRNGGNRRAVRQSGRARHDAYQQSRHARCVCALAWTVATVISQVCLCSRSPARAIRFSLRRHMALVSWGQRDFAPRMQCSDESWEPIGNVKQKQAFARKVPITVACCLCNTRLKTLWRRGFRAVPLLLVQGRSVIVFERRRGASRSRPVFKSCRLRPSRSAGVSEGAMRLKRGPRGQGNQP